MQQPPEPENQITPKNVSGAVVHPEMSVPGLTGARTPTISRAQTEKSKKRKSSVAKHKEKSPKPKRPKKQSQSSKKSRSRP